MFHPFCNMDACFSWLAFETPDACAELYGSDEFPDLYGYVLFYQRTDGVFAVFQVSGLPIPQDPCHSSVFAMHIHGGDSCTGSSADPFADAGAHYNPADCPHPSHAGDLPPLFGNDGYAWGAVFTGRFTVPDVLGKAVIVHRSPDDFMTQPSGNSGARIACGIIVPCDAASGPVLY